MDLENVILEYAQSEPKSMTLMLKVALITIYIFCSIKPSMEAEQPLAATSSAMKTASLASEANLKPPPLMSSRDMTSASLEETVINNQVIPCFNIGGEMRLCFPQILKQILGSFHSEQICLACEELLIHVAPASTQQLVVLKGIY